MRHLALPALLFGALLMPARSHAEVMVSIAGNVATAEIALPSFAVPTFTATLRLTFDSPENLSAANLGIDAFLIDPLDPAFQARLPGPLVSVSSAFPVLIRVEPPFGDSISRSSFELGESGSLDFGFRNAAEIEVRTTNLPYVQDGPARLLRAPVGAAFVDITSEVVAGSIRTRARSGTFSEFVIADDLRDDTQRAAAEYARTDLRLDDPAIAPALRTQLDSALNQSFVDFNNGDFVLALADLATFDALVAGASSADLPDRYRARRDRNNVRGDLQSLSANIAFFLRRLDD